MPFPRIFVSHSAKDKHAEAVLAAIENALGAEFDLFIDRYRLQPGQQWRNELFTRMYRAHGAVILFSEDVFKSTFVPTEVSILGSRPYLDEDFKLLTVLLEDVTVTQIEKEFSAVRPSEVQAIRGKGLTPEQIADAVRQAFLPLIPKQAAQTPFDKLEIMIASLLKGVPDAALRGAAQTLGADLGVWEPTAALATQLARELWQADLIDSTRAINDDLRGYLKETEVEELIELIAPSWVDPCLAVVIPKVARGASERRALAVNGTMEFTANMFVRRACCRAPKGSWPVVPISGVWGTEATESLKAEITAALRSKFKLDTNDPDAILHRVLEKRDGKGGLNEPVFILFPHPAPPQEVFKELRKTFPTVTFFRLTGEHLLKPNDVDAEYFQLLGLESGREMDAYLNYKAARSIL